MNRILDHLRGNLVGYIALVMAVGGTSYAATQLPSNSVGARQIRNHAITPTKFNPKYINGSVRGWAVVDSTGRLIRGGGGPRSVEETVAPGNYIVRWGFKLHRDCATVATIDQDHSRPTENIPIPGNPSVPYVAGYAVAESFTNGNGPNHNSSSVNTFNQQGQLTPLGFSVTVVC